MAQPENVAQKQKYDLRQRVAGFVEHQKFTGFITALILFNALTLGLATSDVLEARYGDLLGVVDHVIIWIFVVELTLKLFAWRGSFFRSGWNNFDFIIVAISLFPASGPFAVMRTLRVFRVLRLISVVPRMRRVVDALLSAIPGMASVLAVLLVIFYVSAVLAAELFSAPELDLFFGTISRSMYTLFQILTLEDWAEIARETMGYYPWAWVYFVTFIVITSFAVLNLFIGIIVDAMNLVHEEDLQAEKEAAHADALSIHDEIVALRLEITRLADKIN